MYSVDVFDTLLLRKPISERSRFYKAATAFVRICPSHTAPSVASVYAARIEVNRWAYHSIDTLGEDAEVKIMDIFTRQLLLLGLPTELAPLLLVAEIEVEKTVLEPNLRLIRWLRFQRSRHVRVIAISDTSLPGSALQTIMTASPNRARLIACTRAPISG